MGHKAGSRHTGGVGTLKARRIERARDILDMVDAGTALEVQQVQKLAMSGTTKAMQKLIDIAGEDADPKHWFPQIAAAREILRVAGVYPQAGRPGQKPGSGIGALQVNISNLSTPQAPVTVEVIPLQPQDQLSDAPEPLDGDEALDA